MSRRESLLELCFYPKALFLFFFLFFSCLDQTTRALYSFLYTIYNSKQPKQSRICISKPANHNTPSGAFYIIGVIMFLLLCMCFPFIFGRDDNTLFVTCIYSVFTSYFFRYRYALQQASQIRQVRFKISANKSRSISNCFNALMHDGSRNFIN